MPDSVGKKLFSYRVELIAELDKLGTNFGEQETSLRAGLAEFLQIEVAGMNLDNFIVRPKRRFVERFALASAWERLASEDLTDLTGEVAGLPSSVTDDDQDAKLFDLLMLRMQLTLLRHEPGFDRMQAQVMKIASLLEEKEGIPIVAAQLELLRELQIDEFWTDVQTVQLETVRKKLRSLVSLIERVKRKIVYTAFEDEIGEETRIPLPDVPIGVDVERLKAKATAFLKRYEDDVVLQKLKWNEPLTVDDLESLEAIFLSEGTSSASIAEAARVSDGLGLFVRSLVGVDRAAARRAFGSFLATRTLSVNQIKFVEIIIDHLSRAGFVHVKDLYGSPFVDLHPSGVDGLFEPAEVQQMLSILIAFRKNAQGSLNARSA